MASTAPSTPDNSPLKMTNRSFTVPARLAGASHNNSPSDPAVIDGVKTLYVHPNVKVIKFTANAPPASVGGGPSSSASLLPWTSPTETTVAAGRLELYKMPETAANVSFLRSGKWLHSVMPRSNCWCVDGVGKFAVPAREGPYYRIELPVEMSEDLARLEEFKNVLPTVLSYEKTACPFKRSFTVDLPEEQPTVRRRRRKTHGPAKKWKLETGRRWKPEDGEESPEGAGESSGSTSGTDDEAPPSAQEVGSPEEPDSAGPVKGLSVNSPSTPTVRERVQDWSSRRSVSSPIKSSAQIPRPIRKPTIENADWSEEDASSDGTADQETTARTFQAIPVDMPPSPPDSSAGYEVVDTAPRSDRKAAMASTIDSHFPTLEAHPASTVDDMEDSDADADADTVPVASPHIPDQSDAVSGSLRSTEAEELPSDSSQGITTEDDSQEVNVLPRKSNEIPAGHAIEDVREVQNPNHESEVPAGHGIEEVHGVQNPDHESEVPTGHGIEEVHGVQNPDHESTEATSTSQLGEDDVAPDHSQKTAAQPEPVVVAIGSSSPQDEEVADSDGTKPPQPERLDPYAQIQARIQARRSIGGTMSFVPGSTKSSSSSSTSISSVMQPGFSRKPSQHQQAFASALVRKACDVFLGPPIRLVMIMLEIASRLASGRASGARSSEESDGEDADIPDTYDLDSDLDDFDPDDERDDFGVPLRSPVRLATASKDGAARATGSDVHSLSAKERRIREID